jgi:hypothetical protein
VLSFPIVSAKTEIKSLHRHELMARLAELGEPAYRADQIFQWVYQKNATTLFSILAGAILTVNLPTTNLKPLFTIAVLT